MKKGLPSDRSTTRSTRSRGGSTPRIAASSRRRLARLEPGDVDPLDAAGALDLRDPRQQRVASMELVRAEREEQGRRIRAQVPDEVGQGLPRAGIRPMQVLDDEQQGAPRGEALDQAQDRFEQPRLQPLALGAGLGQIGPRHERRKQASKVGPGWADDLVDLLGPKVAVELAQRLDDRAVRHAGGSDVHARAAQHAHATLAREAHRFVDQSALADAGLAGQEEVAGATALRLVEGALDRSDLGFAAHHDRTDEAATHAPDDRGGHVHAVARRRNRTSRPRWLGRRPHSSGSTRTIDRPASAAGRTRSASSRSSCCRSLARNSMAKPFIARSSRGGIHATRRQHRYDHASRHRGSCLSVSRSTARFGRSGL